MYSGPTSGFRILKGILLVYNVVFWISGPGILGLGIWFYIILNEYSPLVERDDFAIPAFVVMVSGSTCILAGIIGWTGTVGEKPALLSTYSCFMVTVLSAEVAGAVLAFLLYDKTTEKLEPRLNLTFITKYNKEYETTKTVDKMQIELRCCGVRDYADWTDTQLYGRTVTHLPLSCCRNASRHCDSEHANLLRGQEANIYHRGCLEALSFWMETRLFFVGWITAACACWQVIGISCVCCFHKAVTGGYG